MKVLLESEGSAGGHWKSRPKKQRSRIKDNLSQPWVCEETDPFIPCIRYFNIPKRMCMPSHVKTYEGSEDPENQLKIFRGQQKWNVRQCQHGATCSIPHLLDSLRDVKRASKIMRISGFMHGITNPELIKHLHEKILKSVDEMMRITTSFLREQAATDNQERKKSIQPWK
nr:reverse transcriptase domain-containing protein [Tanacetum cinerariifolium]